MLRRLFGKRIIKIKCPKAFKGKEGCKILQPSSHILFGKINLTGKPVHRLYATKFRNNFQIHTLLYHKICFCQGVLKNFFTKFYIFSKNCPLNRHSDAYNLIEKLTKLFIYIIIPRLNIISGSVARNIYGNKDF